MCLYARGVTRERAVIAGRNNGFSKVHPRAGVVVRVVYSASGALN